MALPAILLLAGLIRGWISGFTPILLDYDAFYHARIAEYIYQNHHIPAWDPKELGGIPHYYPPLYHIMIALGKYILPERSFIAIGSLLTVFFGIISTLFVYLIGRKFSEGVALTSALIYSLTPMMVLRSGLWARPTGLSMLFTIFVVYLFLRMVERRDARNISLALIVSLAYIFAHSSILLVLFLILAVSLVSRNREGVRTFFGITLFSLLAGGMYYYKAIPSLNFSLAHAGEYLPLIHPLMELYPFSGLWALTAAALFLGLFNLTNFPIVFHGIYLMVKRKKELGIFAFFSLFIIFFKANMFMLLNFTVCIAIAVSLFKISDMTIQGGNRKISGGPLAVLLLLMVVGMNISAVQQLQGEKKHVYVDAVEAILSDAPLTPKNLVLASDPNIGHGIPYYSLAGTFISDLTDTKQYDKNRKVFDRLMGEDIDAGEAVNLLIDNNIDHILIIGDSYFPFMKDSEQNFVLIRKVNKNGVKAYLYKLEPKIVSYDPLPFPTGTVPLPFS